MFKGILVRDRREKYDQFSKALIEGAKGSGLDAASLSQAAADCDNSVVANLDRGMDIKQAIRAANQEHPEEALKPGADHWPGLAARYQYIREHKAILKTLGMRD